MIGLKNVSKIYGTSYVETHALQEISINISEGEFLAITGPSGCGKSTLLNILGFLDRPSGGEYIFMGKNVERATERELTKIRRSSVGFIFQNFNLIDDLTVEENVDVALIYRSIPADQRRKKIADVLERVGIPHRARHLPGQLSGGQQQRVAIARALVAEPKLILADEPTGNLDTSNGQAVMELLTSATHAGTTVIMVTHSDAHAAAAGRVVKMVDGRIDVAVGV